MYNTFMLKIYVDKKKYYVKDSNNLLETCLSIGLDIPYFCWHPALGSVGFCRQCVVKQYKNSEDKNGKLIVSCMTPIHDKMHVSIYDDESLDFRKKIIELMMINHPHDCPVCPEGGNCHLQDMTVMVGHFSRRYRFNKKVYKNQYLGPFIKHEMNRCISCYRCVRFYKDYADGKDFGVYGIRNNIYFGRFEDGSLENEFSGNLVEICPTGVFTDKTQSNHYFRKWDLQYTSSICHHCSLGCNLLIGSRDNKVSRVENRYHSEINGYFICDRGRFIYDYLNDSNCSKIAVFINGKRFSYKDTINNIVLEISKIFKNNENTIGIGSARASLESNFMLKELVGEDNFYLGITESEYERLSLILNIIKNIGIHIPSIKEIENYDLIFILGEDIANTAPRMSLAVRQAVKKKSFIISDKLGIYHWNNGAITNINKNKNIYPLFITSIDKNKLDDISSWTYYDSFENQAKLGFTIASNLDIQAPNYSGDKFNKEVNNKIKIIIDLLKKSRRPLIISGCNTGCKETIMAASNIALSLKKIGKDVGINFVLPSVNSMGLIALGGKILARAFSLIDKDKIDNVILLENDLCYHYPKKFISHKFSKLKNLIIIDYIISKTDIKNGVFLPSTNFIESDGTVINFEGRAQRFFKLYNDDLYHNNEFQKMESWRWIDLIISRVNKNNYNFNDVGQILKYLSIKMPIFSRLSEINIINKNIKKLAKKTHRYSGRTTFYFKKSLSKLNKMEENKHSIFTKSTEGININSKNHASFYWLPGWNSVQSINKFSNYKKTDNQNIVYDINLFNFKINNSISYFKIKNNLDKIKSKYIIVPYWRFLGSDEILQKSDLIKDLTDFPYAIINEVYNKEKKNIDRITFDYWDTKYIFKVKLSKLIPLNNIGLYIGYADIPLELLGQEINNFKIIYKDLYI